MRVGKRSIAVPSLVTGFIQLVTVTLLSFCAASLTFAEEVPASNTDVARAHHIASQIDRLAGAIKDEYASEVPNGRRIRFVDFPDLGTLAIATFVIEGVARGNNVQAIRRHFRPA
jgi:hypothetical protein